MLRKFINKVPLFSNPLINETLWLTIEVVMSRGMFAIAMMVAARYMGTTIFGKLSALQTTVVVMVGFISDGLRITATQQVAGDDSLTIQNIGRVVTNLVFIAVGISLVLLAIIYSNVDWVSKNVFNDASLSGPLKIGLLYLMPVEVINGVILGVMSGLKLFRNLAITSLFRGIFLVLSVFFGDPANLSWMLVCLSFAAFVCLASRLFLLDMFLKKSKIKLSFDFRKSDLLILRDIALPATVSGLFFMPINWLVNLMIINSENGYHEMGVFGLAQQWFSFLLFMPNVMASVLLTYMAGSYKGKNIDDLRRKLKIGVVFNLSMSLLTVIVLVLLRAKLVEFYGNGFDDVGVAIMIAAIGASFASLVNLLTNFSMSVGKVWESIRPQFTWAFMFLFFSYFSLSMGLGAIGFVAALAMAYFTRLCHALYQANNFLIKIY